MTAFRITNRSATRTVMNGLQDNLARMARLQEQLSSGKVLNRPSDSPVGTSSAMQFRSQIRAAEQFVRNADDGINWLGATDDTLTTVVSAAGRARTLILAGLNGTASDTEREALATEIEAIRAGLIDTANGKYLDRPLFAGTANVSMAYDRETGAFLGNAADETSGGAAGMLDRRIAPGVSVRVNLTGPEVFGVSDEATGERDLFALLEQAAAHLRAGDNDALGTDLSAFDDRMNQIQNQHAKVGARYHQVETMRARSEDHLIDLRGNLSNVEDIDLPKTIVDLQMQEVSYQAALSATARVIQPSLLDFLR